MHLDFTSDAIKELKKLPQSDKAKARKKIESLLGNPLLGKKLKGEFTGLRSLKAWPLRVIYSFDATLQIVTIITVDYRGNVYEK